MLKKLHVFTFLLVMLFSSYSWALKVGYVNLRKALSSVSEGQVAMTKLQKKKLSYQVKLDKAKKELESEKNQYDKTATILRGDAKLRLQKKLQTKFIQLRTKYTEWTQRLAKEEAKETRQIIIKMQPIIQEIARSNGLAYMLEMKESGILYGPPSMDFTNELIRKYDAKYGSSGGSKKGKKRKKRKKRK